MVLDGAMEHRLNRAVLIVVHGTDKLAALRCFSLSFHQYGINSMVDPFTLMKRCDRWFSSISCGGPPPNAHITAGVVKRVYS